MNQNLAIAYNIKRKNAKKMASGGMAGCYAGGGEVEKEAMSSEEMPMKRMAKMDPKMLVSRMMKKKMADGGMVEGDNEDMPINLDSKHDDFLSDEEHTEGPNEEAGNEFEEGISDDEDREGLLSRIIGHIRYSK